MLHVEEAVSFFQRTRDIFLTEFIHPFWPTMCFCFHDTAGTCCVLGAGQINQRNGGVRPSVSNKYTLESCVTTESDSMGGEANQ